GREDYRAADADLVAWNSARRPKRCRLAQERDLQRLVAGKLKRDWSPQQIAGWLKERFPKSPEKWVSHETIYSQPILAFAAIALCLADPIRDRLRRAAKFFG